MSKNHFVIERNGESWDNAPIVNYENMTHMKMNYLLNSDYNDMKDCDYLSDFVIAAMAVTDEVSHTYGGQTIITLVDKNDIFIWSIIMDYVEDRVNYALVDWKKDGKNYRYAS